jgi:Ras-related protein Rab-5C
MAEARQIGFKIVIIGPNGIGKSSIVSRLMTGRFEAQRFATIAPQTYAYDCHVESGRVRQYIWDTAGQERFRSISTIFFRNAAAAILVYDITSISSFDNLTWWLNKFQELALPNAYTLLVGNKSDLEAERQVASQSMKAFADQHRLQAVETSAQSGQGINEAFARLALEVYLKIMLKQIILTGTGESLPQDPPAEPLEQQQKECC